MDKKLLEILACPRCDTRPALAEREDQLVCTECGYAYPVVDGIPHLLVEDAIPPEDKDERS
ncbi:MAG: Trm112 family protein [Armatimonadetes bacterium]|nr:Trm112 family protein [Armatimonadota bacterium]